MNPILTLLKPRIRSAINGGRSGGNRVSRLLFLGLTGLFLWGGIFVVSLRVFRYFAGIEELGEILVFKLVSLMLVTILSLLVFSAVLTALSKLYLSRDLYLVHSMPVSGYRIFAARWMEATVDSSWMVLAYTLPVYIALGMVHRGGILFYMDMAAVLLSLALISSIFGSVVVLTAVVVLPATRVRSILIFFGLLLFLVLYLAFRLLRPERLVDPEAFTTALSYLKSLKDPASPLLPSTWAYDSIRAALSGIFTESFFHLALCVSFAGALIPFSIVLADRIYFKGFSRSQSASERKSKTRGHPLPVLNFLPRPVRAFVVKEIRTFFRDQTQWSQLFLIGALVVIYLYNFKVLPLEKSPIPTLYLQNLLSFLNMGLAAFVLSAVSARFAFPAVSMEREALWMVRSSPIRLKTFLWIKFAVYYIPLLLLTEILIIATNLMLDVSPFMMALSTATIFLLVPGVVSMAIGLGAAFPDFKSENPVQSVTGYGGLLYMLLCAGFIAAVILLEAGPVHRIFMAGVKGRELSAAEWAWMWGSFSAAFGVSILAVFFPMRFGEKRLVDSRI